MSMLPSPRRQHGASERREKIGNERGEGRGGGDRGIGGVGGGGGGRRKDKGNGIEKRGIFFFFFFF